MYTYEQRMKAIKTYIANGRQMNKTICQLGYPTHQALRGWYKEYLEKGDLHQNFIRKPLHTEEQKQAAIECFYANGCNYRKTSVALGYVGPDRLRQWIRESMPKEKKDCIPKRNAVKCTQEQKRTAVVEFMARGGGAEKIANSCGVSHSNLYFWREQLLAGECAKQVSDSNFTKKDIAALQHENEELLRHMEELKQQNIALEKQRFRLQLEVDVLTKAGEILKKEKGINLNDLTNREKALVIDALRKKYRLHYLLECVEISKSSYCYQEKALKRNDKYEELRGKLKAAFAESNGCYGYRRLHAILVQDNNRISEKVVRRLMKEEGLSVRRIRHKHYNSYMGEISPAVENLVARNFHADQPNQKWLTDITEFSIPAGKIYLSPIIDCFDGMAVSWSIGTSPNADLVNSMLDTAITQLEKNEHPMIHSDRGGHYRWPGWIKRMSAANLPRSMSKKGCSPDNAACEGFFGRLKNEMFYGFSWEGVSTENFIAMLDGYMHWYNTTRIKASLGWKSPTNYRRSLGLL